MPPASSQPSRSGFLSLLRDYRFLILWGGQLISQVADKVFFVLLIALVVNYRPIPALANSMRSAVLIALTLPAIFFGSAAGIFVDRWSKKQVLVICNLLRGVLILAIPFLPKDFVVLLVITFVVSSLTQLFAPAEQAAIPLLVRRKNLMSANALFTTTMMGALVVGFAVGEPLLSWSSSWGGIYGREVLVGGLYLLAAALLSSIPLRERRRPKAVHANPWSDLKQGFHYLMKNRLVGDAMIQLTVLYCMFAALSVLAIPLAEDIGLKPTQFGFLLAAAGVGLLIGAGILGHGGDRFQHPFVPLIGFLSMTVVLAAFSFTTNLPVGLGLSVLLGIGASLVGVPMQTLIQLETPASMRGKVFGFQNNALNIAMSVPLAVAGILADLVGLRIVLISMSVVVGLAGGLAWLHLRQGLYNS
ncbi:MAG TPA: MFS transporter [Candidatus Caenarcaniphilales bacterium]